MIPESIESRLETRDEFSVDIVSTGDSALRSIGAFVPDALLRLEAMLPGLDASEPCQRTLKCGHYRTSENRPLQVGVVSHP